LGGFLDVAEIAAPATPAADTLRLYVEDVQGFSFYKYLDSGGMKREVLRDSMILVYNNSGSQILANRVVYASGSFNNFPTVALAKSNSVSTMPAIGVTIENINNSAYGRVMQVGLLEDIDTSALSVGDILYVHDTVAGLVRITAPTTPALTQEIGTVLVDNASTGAIQIIARGLTGDEHGTAQNDFYIGDGTAGSKTLHFNAVTDASIIWDETKFDLTASPLTTTGAVTAGSLVLTTDLAVTHGGTGASTLTDHGILLGSGTAAITPLGAATTMLRTIVPLELGVMAPLSLYQVMLHKPSILGTVQQTRCSRFVVLWVLPNLLVSINLQQEWHNSSIGMRLVRIYFVLSIPMVL
jgi:hypothetical protein